jgi:pyruvate dehydrogenase E2 component (dihydrolipoamide acetyltransferase)
VTVVDIAMPRLSDSMEEATILTWLKRPGDSVSRGEPLVEVETDKATVVYEAERDGVLDEIVVQEGRSAALGRPIARLRVETAATPAAPEAVGLPAPRPGRARATPVARRHAAEHGISLDGVTGNGPGGRIVLADLQQLARESVPTTTASSAAEAAPGELRHSATQRTIAARMVESRSTIPDFTLEAEVAMAAAARVREELRLAFADALPSFNDLVVRAAALALRDHPALNASFAGAGAVRHPSVNVGVAVATDDALLVPVIRDADRKSVLEISADARRLATGARDRTLGMDDLAGGTFTISNLGMFGVRRFHAVINPPEAAILAVGQIGERPTVREGRIVPMLTMDVTLSCDHRVVYGADAARFLQRFRELLEHPSLLLIEGRDG